MRVFVICTCYNVAIDDPNDRSFLINGQSQFIVWAYGPRAVEESLRNLAFFHIEYPRNGGASLIIFGYVYYV